MGEERSYGTNIWAKLHERGDGVTIVGARTPSADGEPLFRRFPAE